MQESGKHVMKKACRSLAVLAFLLIVLFNLYAEDFPCEWTGVERIVAVGDLHGDYQNFIKILKAPEIQIIDDDHHWIAGKTHFVQIGDVMDRGPDAGKIFELLRELEKEAEKAGGKVHMLIGNHEEMNIGDFAFDRRGYVTVGQLLSFLPPEYIKKEESKIRKKLRIQSSPETDSGTALDPNIRAFWQDKISQSMNVRFITKRHVRWHYIREFNEKYAPWILQHNAVIKINDVVFVHGGISETFSTWPLKELNDQLRRELDMFRVARLLGKEPDPDYEIVYNENGPLWFRDYSYRGPEFEPTVDRILKNLKAVSIITAHTPQQVESETEMSRYNGKVWIIDTNISRAYPRGKLSALVIENSEKPLFKPWLKSREYDPPSITVPNEIEGMPRAAFFVKITIGLLYIYRTST